MIIATSFSLSLASPSAFVVHSWKFVLKIISFFGDGYYGDGTEAVAVRRIGGGPGSLCGAEGAVAETVVALAVEVFLPCERGIVRKEFRLHELHLRLGGDGPAADAVHAECGKGVFLIRI